MSFAANLNYNSVERREISSLPFLCSLFADLFCVLDQSGARATQLNRLICILEFCPVYKLLSGAGQVVEVIPEHRIHSLTQQKLPLDLHSVQSIATAGEAAILRCPLLWRRVG